MGDAYEKLLSSMDKFMASMEEMKAQIRNQRGHCQQGGSPISVTEKYPFNFQNHRSTATATQTPTYSVSKSLNKVLQEHIDHEEARVFAELPPAMERDKSLSCDSGDPVELVAKVAPCSADPVSGIDTVIVRSDTTSSVVSDLCSTLGASFVGSKLLTAKSIDSKAHSRNPAPPLPTAKSFDLLGDVAVSAMDVLLLDTSPFDPGPFTRNHPYAFHSSHSYHFSEVFAPMFTNSWFPPNVKQNEHLMQLNHNCDMFEGTWVMDDSCPLYKSGSYSNFDETLRQDTRTGYTAMIRMRSVKIQSGYSSIMPLTALQLFDQMPKCQVAVWNAIINGCEAIEHEGAAFDLYKDMPRMDMEHGNYTSTSMLSLGFFELLHSGRHVHFGVNSPILMCFICSCVLDAYEGFGEAGPAFCNLSTYNDMKDGLVSMGRIEYAFVMLRDMDRLCFCPTEASCELFSHGVLDNFQLALNQVENYFLRMIEQEMGKSPNLISIGSCALLLFLHGMDLYTLNELRAVAIDPYDPILSTDDLADQIAEVPNFLGLSAVMCLGVTAGAYILTFFAMEYRQRVLGLILVSPLCKVPSWTEWLYNNVMSNLLYFYGMCGVVKEILQKRYFSKEVRGSAHLSESDIVPACQKSLDERQSLNEWRFLEAINGRSDISEGLRKLQCRSLIFVGDMSLFYSEAQNIFNKMKARDFVSWNIMISRFVQKSIHGLLLNACSQQGLEQFSALLKTHLQPTDYSLSLVLSICFITSTRNLRKQNHGYILQHGCNSEIFLGNVLMPMDEAESRSFGAHSNICWSLFRGCAAADLSEEANLVNGRSMGIDAYNSLAWKIICAAADPVELPPNLMISQIFSVPQLKPRAEPVFVTAHFFPMLFLLVLQWGPVVAVFHRKMIDWGAACVFLQFYSNGRLFS